MFSKLVRIINLCLEKNIPFVSFRLPGERDVKTWILTSGSFNYVEHMDEIAHRKGFVYAPFHRRTNFPIAFFEPGLIIENDDFDNSLYNEFAAKSPMYPDYPTEEPVEVTQAAYLKQAEKFIQSFRPDFTKAVLSRVQIQSKPINFNPGEFFMKLQSHYPGAFCHLINIPGAGTWTGASPETLLRTDDKWANTLSLAGTQSSAQIQWNPKEIEEQKIVSDYIEELFQSLGIEKFKKEKTETHPAGNVVHLSTKFQFSKAYLRDNLAEFLSRLHPTPAVCGLPKDRALNLIMDTEKHNREYYSGYCGVLHPKGNTDLFVNLRCMKILPDKLALFVGGGLTAQSVAKDEWEETEMKLQTLLQLM